MIHTNLPRNCVVFLLLCELTRSAIYGSQKYLDRVSRRGKRQTVQFQYLFVTHVFNFLNIFYPYAFITNGYKRFSKSNSTDSRQRVPLRAPDSSSGVLISRVWVRVPVMTPVSLSKTLIHDALSFGWDVKP